MNRYLDVLCCLFVLFCGALLVVASQFAVPVWSYFCLLFLMLFGLACLVMVMDEEVLFGGS